MVGVVLAVSKYEKRSIARDARPPSNLVQRLSPQDDIYSCSNGTCTLRY